MVRVTFEEGIALLKENGIEWDVLTDLDTPTERKLGEISKLSL
jgi:aspartyl/asparaginyl-tRNA synthetase